MAGKMPPRPSSPLSRSVTKRTARRIAIFCVKRGKNGCKRRPTRSISSMISPIQWPVGLLLNRRMDSGGVRNSSRTSTPLGLRAFGFRASSTINGTITVRDQ